MGNAAAFWANVTDAQATIISAGLTVLAAIVGVALGWWLFSGRVKDLQGALEQSDALLLRHKAEVEDTLHAIATRLGVIDTQFAGIQEALGQLRGSNDVIEST